MNATTVSMSTGMMDGLAGAVCALAVPGIQNDLWIKKGKTMAGDELDMIRSAQAGDLEAFNCLVIAYQDSLFRWVYHLLGDLPLAEDVTQTVFVNAFQKINTFRFGSFRSWLFRIARNQAYDELRRQKRRPAISLDATLGEDQENELMESLPDERPFPEEVVEKREQEKLVRDSLDRLPRSFREVLTLVDMEGLDYQEVAEAIGVPLGTVKSRLARARLQFRRVLAGSQYPVEL